MFLDVMNLPHYNLGMSIFVLWCGCRFSGCLDASDHCVLMVTCILQISAHVVLVDFLSKLAHIGHNLSVGCPKLILVFRDLCLHSV
jgi:hypothetical protein